MQWFPFFFDPTTKKVSMWAVLGFVLAVLVVMAAAPRIPGLNRVIR